jgi:hypothetical protein
VEAISTISSSSNKVSKSGKPSRSPSHGHVEDVHAARFAPGVLPPGVLAPTSTSIPLPTTPAVTPSAASLTTANTIVNGVDGDNVIKPLPIADGASEGKGHRDNGDGKGSDSDRDEGDQGSDDAYDNVLNFHLIFASNAMLLYVDCVD